MTKSECLQEAMKAQRKVERMEATLQRKLDAVAAKARGPIEAEREVVAMWTRKAEGKEPSPDTINAAPEWRTPEEIAEEPPE